MHTLNPGLDLHMTLIQTAAQKFVSFLCDCRALRRQSSAGRLQRVLRCGQGDCNCCMRPPAYT